MTHAEVETAARKLAESEGRTWASLSADDRIAYSSRVLAENAAPVAQFTKADTPVAHCQAKYKGQVSCEVGYMGNREPHLIDDEGRIVHRHSNLTWVADESEVIEVTYLVSIKVTRESWTGIVGEAEFTRDQVTEYLERSLEAESEYGVASEVDIQEV